MARDINLSIGLPDCVNELKRQAQYCDGGQRALLDAGAEMLDALPPNGFLYKPGEGRWNHVMKFQLVKEGVWFTFRARKNWNFNGPVYRVLSGNRFDPEKAKQDIRELLAKKVNRFAGLGPTNEAPRITQFMDSLIGRGGNPIITNHPAMKTFHFVFLFGDDYVDLEFGR